MVPSLLILTLGAASLLFSQSHVDVLVRTLDSLSMTSYDSWKVSPDLKSLRGMTGDPTKAGFDDSRWENLSLNQSIYPDSCWIRKEIVLPSRYLGQPISGPIRFLVSVDDYGYLWVNGESKGFFPWDGEFELTKDARPGEKFLIAIKAINTGGPLRLLRAQIQTERTSGLRSAIGDFSLGMRVAEKLLGFDTYQTSSRKKEDPHIDNSKTNREEKVRLRALLEDLAQSVDVRALGEGDTGKFNGSLALVRSRLGPVRDFVKKYTLYFDANAHIDAAWLWRDKETIEVCRNTFTSVIKMMEERPDFTYTQSAAAYYDWMERLYPDLFGKIQGRVRDGRWEVVGGMWVEPDCNLPGGESWSHHLLYAKRFFRKKLGADVTIGWNPDSFGYNWNMPEFYANAGVDAFITQKIGWNEENVFPYRLFWWQSPDGSRLLTYFPFDYVNTVDDPFALVDWLRQFDANTGLTKMLILFGVGDHGGGPSPEMLDRIEHLKGLDLYPAIEYGTAAGYLRWVKGSDLSKIPVWKDELYLEYHQGTFTTQAKMKEWNRKSEVLLTNVEKTSTLATLFGRHYAGSDIEEAWRNVLFNQFHDILPGSGIRENYIDATEKFEHARTIGTFELNSSLDHITQNINTSGLQGDPLVVMNTLSWARTDVVAAPLPAGSTGEYAIFDDRGREVPSQIVEKDKYDRSILFLGRDIPAMGYRLFGLRSQSPKGPEKDNNAPAGSARKRGSRESVTADEASSLLFAGDEGTLENEFFRVVVDKDSGWMKSILDKRNHREILAGRGNELQMLEDKPKAWDAWNIGLTGSRFPLRLRSVRIVERGPVRATVRISWDYLKPGTQKDPPTPDYPSSFFTQDVVLYRSLDRIEFRTDADWWEEKTMVKVAFPLSFSDSLATYEIPYGTISRSTGMVDRWERAKVEVPAERWADVSHENFGVSLLNRSKYGYDIKGSIIRLSLLRSPKWPDPTADRGKHSIEYSLFPHEGDWKSGGTVRHGYEYNSPLLCFPARRHAGTLSPSHSFLRLDPGNLVLTMMKKAEDSDAWILQWYESEGRNSDAVITLPRSPRKAVMSNLLEEDKEDLVVRKNAVGVQTRKFSLTTIKVYF